VATKINRFNFHASLTYNYVKSINRRVSDNGNVREVGKQLFYTPMHDGSLLLKASRKRYSWTIVYTYTGLQYTDGENSELFALPSYQILSTYLSARFSFDKLMASVKLGVNNLSNVSYENRRGYPLYGRNFSLGINIKYNNKRNE